MKTKIVKKYDKYFMDGSMAKIAYFATVECMDTGTEADIYTREFNFSIDEKLQIERLLESFAEERAEWGKFE